MSDYLEKLKDPRWQKKRLKILKRDEFQCTNYGDGKNTLHVHHIAYHLNKEPWDIENKLLQTLCKTCHAEETESIKLASRSLIDSLKKSGFTSVSMFSLETLFNNKDRSWGTNEPAFSILKMVIEDDILWEELRKIFLSKKP